MTKAKKKHEFALIGDVDDWENDLIKDLLDLRPGSACTFFIDSAGGSVYGALSVLALVKLRRLKVTSYVLGECSSATLLIFAASTQRFVTPYSTLLFHRMRWESEKRVDSGEARHWAKHFNELENDLDDLQARMLNSQADGLVKKWIEESRYVNGRQVAAAGLAELVEL